MIKLIMLFCKMIEIRQLRLRLLLEKGYNWDAHDQKHNFLKK